MADARKRTTSRAMVASRAKVCFYPNSNIIPENYVYQQKYVPPFSTNYINLCFIICRKYILSWNWPTDGDNLLLTYVEGHTSPRCVHILFYNSALPQWPWRLFLKQIQGTENLIQRMNTPRPRPKAEEHSLQIILCRIWGSPAVVMNSAFFWVIAPFSPYVNRCFGGKYHLHLQGKNHPSRKPSIMWLATLKRRMIRFSETSVHTQTARRYTQEAVDIQPQILQTLLIFVICDYVV
jgi:hypothetical protein